MPLAMRPKRIFFGFIPEDLDLGTNERDFSNVKWGCIDCETGGQSKEGCAVEVFSSGRLGILKGGLLFLHDVRPKLTPESVADIAHDIVASDVSSKRTWGSKVLKLTAIGIHTLFEFCELIF